MLGTNEIMQFFKSMADVQAAVAFNRDGDVLNSYGLKDVGSMVQLLLYLKSKGHHIGEALTLSPLLNFILFLENSRLLFIQADDIFIGVQGSSAFSPNKLVSTLKELINRDDVVVLPQ